MLNIGSMELMIKYLYISFASMSILYGITPTNTLSKLTIHVFYFLHEEFNVKLSEFKN